MVGSNDTSQVRDFMARPTGLEPVTLGSEVLDQEDKTKND